MSKMTFEQFAKTIDPRLEKQFEVYNTPLDELVGKKVQSLYAGWGGPAGVRGIVKEIVYEGQMSEGARWGGDYIVIDTGGDSRGALVAHKNYWKEFIFI